MKCDKCQSCGAPIIWTITAKNKRMPVDAEPDLEGLLVLDEGPDGTVRSCVSSSLLTSLFQEVRYTSHFATCPEAARWRRG